MRVVALKIEIKGRGLCTTPHSLAVCIDTRVHKFIKCKFEGRERSSLCSLIYSLVTQLEGCNFNMNFQHFESFSFQSKTNEVQGREYKNYKRN